MVTNIFCSLENEGNFCTISTHAFVDSWKSRAVHLSFSTPTAFMNEFKEAIETSRIIRLMIYLDKKGGNGEPESGFLALNSDTWKDMCHSIQEAMPHLESVHVVTQDSMPSPDYHISLFLEHLPSSVSRLALYLLENHVPSIWAPYHLAKSFQQLAAQPKFQKLTFFAIYGNSIRQDKFSEVCIDHFTAEAFARAINEGMPSLHEIILGQVFLAKSQPCVMEAIRTKKTLRLFHGKNLVFAGEGGCDADGSGCDLLRTFPIINSAIGGTNGMQWDDPSKLKELVGNLSSVKSDFIAFHYIMANLPPHLINANPSCWDNKTTLTECVHAADGDDMDSEDEGASNCSDEQDGDNDDNDNGDNAAGDEEGKEEDEEGSSCSEDEESRENEMDCEVEEASNSSDEQALDSADDDAEGSFYSGDEESYENTNTKRRRIM